VLYDPTVTIVCEGCQAEQTLRLDKHHGLNTWRNTLGVFLENRFEAHGWQIKDDGETLCPRCAKSSIHHLAAKCRPASDLMKEKKPKCAKKQ
jgi:hypothetical protein